MLFIVAEIYSLIWLSKENLPSTVMPCKMILGLILSSKILELCLVYEIKHFRLIATIKSWNDISSPQFRLVLTKWTMLQT